MDPIVQTLLNMAYMFARDTNLTHAEVAERLAYAIGRYAVAAGVEVLNGQPIVDVEILQKMEAQINQGFKDEASQYHGVTSN